MSNDRLDAIANKLARVIRYTHERAPLCSLHAAARPRRANAAAEVEKPLKPENDLGQDPIDLAETAAPNFSRAVLPMQLSLGKPGVSVQC